MKLQVIFTGQFMEYFLIIQKSTDKFLGRFDMLWVANQSIAAIKNPVLVLSNKTFIGRWIFHYELSEG